MTAWIVIVGAAVALSAFGLWVAHLFDAIADYTDNWKAEGDLEDAQATRGTGSC